MNKDYYVFVFIPTYNCVDRIRTTIESVFNQTFDHERLRILAVDNCSNDGTYEELLKLTQKNKKMMSVYRLRKATKSTRVWKTAAKILQHIPNVDYSTILLPGNILYPECIKKCTSILRNMKFFDGNTLLCETDLIDDNGNKYSQQPIYNDNCILRGGHDESEFLIKGIGHRIQPFYKGFSISSVTPLLVATQMIDYNDWFNKIWVTAGDYIYIKDRLACLNEVQLDNPVSDLMQRLVLLKRCYYQQEANEKNVVGNDLIDKENRELSYKCLSILALKYAIKEEKRNKFESANNCILFAEMIYENITKESMYNDVKNVVMGKLERDCLYSYQKLEDSITPPKGCFIF